MDLKARDWVWHDAPDKNFSIHPALVVATDGAPPSRGRNTIALMFDEGSVFWLSRNHIRSCSRDEALKHRSKSYAADPDCDPVEQVEANARRWQERRAERLAQKGVPINGDRDET